MSQPIWVISNQLLKLPEHVSQFEIIGQIVEQYNTFWLKIQCMCLISKTKLVFFYYLKILKTTKIICCFLKPFAKP